MTMVPLLCDSGYRAIKGSRVIEVLIMYMLASLTLPRDDTLRIMNICARAGVRDSGRYG